MFLVFSKQKIFSYIIAFTTVIALLGMAKIYTNKSVEIIETFSKAKEAKEEKEQITNETAKNNQEECINSNESKSNSLVLSEKWNDNDINQILLILKKYNISMKFYITKNWKSKHNSSVNLISNYGHEIFEIENMSNEAN